jgi:hypothetical protein
MINLIKLSNRFVVTLFVVNIEDCAFFANATKIAHGPIIRPNAIFQKSCENQKLLIQKYSQTPMII